MKSIISALLLTCLLGANLASANESQTDYVEVTACELINELRFNSDLEIRNEAYFSPLAEKFDGVKISTRSTITGKKELPDGRLCLTLDYYQSESRSGNWYRKEDFSVDVILDDSNRHIYNTVSKGTWLNVYGTANINYNWEDIHIDKSSQDSLRGLSNYQGNGRGHHIYSFEITDAKVDF